MQYSIFEFLLEVFKFSSSLLSRSVFPLVSLPISVISSQHLLFCLPPLQDLPELLRDEI